MQQRWLPHQPLTTIWVAHRLGHLLQVSWLYTVYVQFLNYYLNWLLLPTKSNPLLCNLPKANVEQYVLMLLFLSHLFCGPCGKESASQGVCLACHVSSAWHLENPTNEMQLLETNILLWRVSLFPSGWFERHWTPRACQGTNWLKHLSLSLLSPWRFRGSTWRPLTWRSSWWWQECSQGRFCFGMQLKILALQRYPGCGQGWHRVLQTPEGIRGNPPSLPCPWLAPYLQQGPEFDFQGETDEGKDFEAGKEVGGCASV